MSLITPNKYRVRAFLAALEATYGVDVGPNASNALLVAGDFMVAANIETAKRDIVRPYLGAQQAFPVSSSFTLTGSIEFAGSGTQGVAPAWGALLMACGFAQTTVTGLGTIQTSPPTASGTPVGSFTYANTTAFAGQLPRLVTLVCTTAGGSGVAAFTVSAPATSIDAAYNQAGVIMTGGQALTLPNSAKITPAVTGAFAVGDTFTIQLMPPYVYYTPVSDTFSSLTCYANFSKKNHVLLGIRGNVEISMDAKAIPKFKFTMTALYGSVTEQDAPPATNLTAWQKPVAVNSVNTAMPTLQGFSSPLYSFSLNMGNKVTMMDLPGEQFVTLEDRDPSGSITIIDPTPSTWDYYTAVRNAILGGLNITHGTTPGNIVSIQAAATAVSKPSYVDKNGDVALKLDLSFMPTIGNDEIKILCY